MATLHRRRPSLHRCWNRKKERRRETETCHQDLAVCNGKPLTSHPRRATHLDDDDDTSMTVGGSAAMCVIVGIGTIARLNSQGGGWTR